MYENRKQMQKELREKKWFYYVILAIGIFIFSQGCSLIKKSTGYAATAVILGIIMHNASVDKIFKRIFKFSSHKNSKIIMIISLFLIAIISCFINLGFIVFMLLDLASIILFVLLSLILSKLINKQE